ncbi:MAG: hypothetical protein LBB30_05845 [Candidatus Methanoplasma sp.]|jgi:hypothetical protein|nr:hypothetical protein [Candidatus Methanoplasma sp.]
MSDESSNFAVGSADLFKIIMLAGSIVGIVSVFLLWFSMEFVIVQFNYSGYDLFMKTHGYPDEGYFIYMPLIVLSASAASVIVSVTVFTKHELKAAAAGIALGAAVLISVILYILYPLSKIWVSSPEADLIADMKLMDHMGGGAYSAIVAGIFLVAGSISVLLLRRRTQASPEEDERPPADSE